MPASDDRPPRDDLLSGFGAHRRRATELRGFFASTLAGSLVAWQLAFDFGAYHTIFYWRLFQVMVVSVVLLVCSVVLGRQVTVRRWTMAVFVPPILWLAFRLVTQPQPMVAWYRAVDAALVGLAALSVPLVLWVLARILAPELFALPSRRLRVSAAAIVILVAIIGFLVGWFNYHVVTCQDFVVAGDDTPANCRESTHDR